MFLEQIASRRLELAMAAGGFSPKKAKIVNLHTDDKIEVSFNPKEIGYRANPRYQTSKEPNAPRGHHLTYCGNGDNELEMELLFDTTMSGDSVHSTYIAFLIELTMPIKIEGMFRPPTCRFRWGSFAKKGTDDYLSFDAVLDKLDVKYTWFLANGKPVRATANVKFTMVDWPVKGQNPTSRTEARRVWRVIEGQTLDWIAYKEYGDSAAWRHIAQVNNLRNPRDLRPGMVLLLVPLP